jgi:hypothetical protein
VAVSHPAAARWPKVPAGRGHYESYYLRAVDPARPRGVWIRYTVTRLGGQVATGQLWFTFFDRTADCPRALRVDTRDVTAGNGEWIRLGTSTFDAADVAGEARNDHGFARWSLCHSSAEPPLLHLPRSWMYTTRLPRTKLLSLSPVATFDGTIEVNGELIDVAGWPGMIGHNWGAQHAANWIWLHGLGFEGYGPDTWLDVAVARVKLGPLTTPWIANGVLSIGGERSRLGVLGRPVVVDAADDRCELRIPGVGRTVTVRASAPRSAFVEWDYADPDGSPHRVLNCSVADLSVDVEGPGVTPVELRAVGRGAYEFGREGAVA